MTKKLDRRTMWSVTVVNANGAKDTGIYRSRHSEAKGVRSEFAKSGQKVLKVVKA